jgi:hypothetical protein
MLSTTAGTGGDVAPADGWYDIGTTGVIVTATPQAGYHFAGWTGDTVVTNENPVTVTMDRPREVVAHFAVSHYNITASAQPHGQVNPDGVVRASPGSNITFTVTADAHYHVADVKVDDLSVGPVPGVTFSNVRAEHTLEVWFAANLVTNGLPETWLVLHGRTSNSLEAAFDDQDHDGMATIDEWDADTVPTNNRSVLAIVGLTLSNGTPRVERQGGVWATQYLETADALLPRGERWTVIFTNVPPTTVITNVIDGGATNRMLNYRIRAVRQHQTC